MTPPRKITFGVLPARKGRATWGLVNFDSCKRGETSAKTGCTPESGEGGKKESAFENLEEGHKYANDIYGEWHKELSEDQKDAIDDYKIMEYLPINKGLREGKVPSDQKERMDLIDKAIESAPPLSSPLTVYRNLGRGKKLEGLKVGDTLHDKAYGSTSLSKDFATGESEVSSIATIEIPQGAKVAYIDANANPAITEGEFLIPKGADFKIKEIEKTPKGLRLVLSLETKGSKTQASAKPGGWKTVNFDDCKRGETAAKTGCTPESGEGGKEESEEIPEIKEEEAKAKKLNEKWKKKATENLKHSTERLSTLEEKMDSIDDTRGEMTRQELGEVGDRMRSQIKWMKPRIEAGTLPEDMVDTYKRFTTNLEKIGARIRLRKAIYQEERRIKGLEEVRDSGKLSIYESEIGGILHKVKDTYVENKIIRPGESSRGMYEPDTFVTSDLSGKKMRRYVELPDGRIAHPDEIHSARKRGRLVVVEDPSTADIGLK
jgi:hypothetical protein